MNRGLGGSQRGSVLAGVDAFRLAEILVDLLDEHVSDLDDAGFPVDELTGAVVETFGDADVLADDAGFVIALRGGAEFQVTVVQSRR